MTWPLAPAAPPSPEATCMEPLAPAAPAPDASVTEPPKADEPPPPTTDTAPPLPAPLPDDKLTAPPTASGALREADTPPSSPSAPPAPAPLEPARACNAPLADEELAPVRSETALVVALADPEPSDSLPLELLPSVLRSATPLLEPDVAALLVRLTWLPIPERKSRAPPGKLVEEPAIMAVRAD